MGLNIDLDRARQVVQGLKGLGDHLVPAGAPAAESAVSGKVRCGCVRRIGIR